MSATSSARKRALNPPHLAEHCWRTAIRQLQELYGRDVDYGHGLYSDYHRGDGQSSGHDSVSFPLRLCCSRRWDGSDMKIGARTTEGTREGEEGEFAGRVLTDG